MKGLRKILVRSFFLLALSLCLGINSYSYYNLHHVNSEISACAGNAENSFDSHSDALNDDQIEQSDNSLPLQEHHILIPTGKAFFPIHIFGLSIWQPPKIF